MVQGTHIDRSVGYVVLNALAKPWVKELDLTADRQIGTSWAGYHLTFQVPHLERFQRFGIRHGGHGTDMRRCHSNRRETEDRAGRRIRYRKK